MMTCESCSHHNVLVRRLRIIGSWAALVLLTPFVFLWYWIVEVSRSFKHAWRQVSPSWKYAKQLAHQGWPSNYPHQWVVERPHIGPNVFKVCRLEYGECERVEMAARMDTRLEDLDPPLRYERLRDDTEEIATWETEGKAQEMVHYMNKLDELRK